MLAMRNVLGKKENWVRKIIRNENLLKATIVQKSMCSKDHSQLCVWTKFCYKVTIDTSFEHSTGNPTKSDRFVLIVDFWHPDLNEAEIAALTYIYDLRNKFETGKIPFRKPKVDTEEEGQGLEGIFKSLFRNEKN